MRLLFFIFLSTVFTIVLTIGSYIFFDNYTHNRPLFQLQQISQIAQIGPTATPTPKPNVLEKYTILNLANRVSQPSQIVFDEPVATTAAYTKYIFHYQSDGKKVTGLATVPSVVTSLDSAKKLPVIVQFRGYVERSAYKPGIGTNRSAEVFAEHGYISLAPDFLGYGQSDMPSTDIFEERFQTYTVALDLIHSVSSIPFADSEKLAIWGHSNGGHIALTVAEILNKPVPVVVWAPVTKYFPYSILYYTDEAPDGGKALRKKLAEFEENYDTDEFTLAKYLDRLVGSIQFHQGTADAAVPKIWSDEFVDAVKKLDKDITYYVYAGADHNLQPGWNTVVERDLEFFKENL